MVVRYSQPSSAGQFQIREAISGSAESRPECQRLPVSSCFTPDWSDGSSSNQLLETFDPTTRAEFRNVSIELDAAPGNQNVTQLDICFSPLGRAYVSSDQGVTFTPLTAIPTARVWRAGEDGDPMGLQRSVLIIPNGNARLDTSDVRAP